MPQCTARELKRTGPTVKPSGGSEGGQAGGPGHPLNLWW